MKFTTYRMYSKNKMKQFPRRGLCYNLVTRICSLTSLVYTKYKNSKCHWN